MKNSSILLFQFYKNILSSDIKKKSCLSLNSNQQGQYSFFLGAKYQINIFDCQQSSNLINQDGQLSWMPCENRNSQKQLDQTTQNSKGRAST